MNKKYREVLGLQIEEYLGSPISLTEDYPFLDKVWKCYEESHTGLLLAHWLDSAKPYQFTKHFNPHEIALMFEEEYFTNRTGYALKGMDGIRLVFEKV